jgi:hypothetical protein
MEQKATKKIGFDLNALANAFALEVVAPTQAMHDWTSAAYELSELEQELFDEMAEEIAEDSGYWNEEELKIDFVGLAFRIAKIKIRKKIKVFYERPLSAVVNGYELSVVSDCIVATPEPFHAPRHPYFFLQEFKKKRGEKKDPEAQMLTAMLIAQELNQDNKPIYGGYLIGPNWHFTILDGKNYCTSGQFDATKKSDLLQIIFILRKLKELILGRTL